jgi:solute carrier family 25 (mitochondrial phosphate transporter), member 3
MAATAPPTTTGSTKLDSIVQTAVSKEPQKLSGVALYSRFVRLKHVAHPIDKLLTSSQAFAGAVCCSVTHGGLTPVDV